jgi:hypothetical protein
MPREGFGRPAGRVICTGAGITRGARILWPLGRCDVNRQMVLGKFPVADDPRDLRDGRRQAPAETRPAMRKAPRVGIGRGGRAGKV